MSFFSKGCQSCDSLRVLLDKVLCYYDIRKFFLDHPIGHNEVTLDQSYMVIVHLLLAAFGLRNFFTLGKQIRGRNKIGNATQTLQHECDSDNKQINFKVTLTIVQLHVAILGQVYRHRKTRKKLFTNHVFIRLIDSLLTIVRRNC